MSKSIPLIVLDELYGEQERVRLKYHEAVRALRHAREEEKGKLLGDPLAYTLRRAAEIAGVGRSTVYDAIKAKKLDSTLIWGRRIIMSDDLADWMRRRRRS